MSYGSALYYWAACDSCGKRCEYDDGYAAWAHQDQVDAYARDIGWYVEGGYHLCSDCIIHIHTERNTTMGRPQTDQAKAYRAADANDDPGGSEAESLAKIAAHPW